MRSDDSARYVRRPGGLTDVIEEALPCGFNTEGVPDWGAINRITVAIGATIDTRGTPAD